MIHMNPPASDPIGQGSTCGANHPCDPFAVFVRTIVLTQTENAREHLHSLVRLSCSHSLKLLAEVFGKASLLYLARLRVMVRN